MVYLDHKNLTYFWRTQNLNQRQAWWSLLLSEYDIKLHHMPGIKITQANALSRRSNLLDLELQNQILKATDLDFGVSNALEKLLDRELSNLANNSDNWKVENFDNRKAIFYKKRNYIPQDVDLWQDIMKMYHDHKTVEHPDELKTYNAVKGQYWWPGLRTFIKNYVKGCAICQQFKIDHHPSITIPTTFEHTKYPSIEEWINRIIRIEKKH